ncbi:hypothetical protein OROMI_007979 [Orobanche minor]
MLLEVLCAVKRELKMRWFYYNSSVREFEEGDCRYRSNEELFVGDKEA